jgi:hypothetical protein
MQKKCRLFLSRMPEAETLGILLKNNMNNSGLTQLAHFSQKCHITLI